MMPLAIESHLHLWYMLVLSSVNLLDFGASLKGVLLHCHGSICCL